MNWNKEIENISKWIKKYIQKSGTKGAVIGVSGGIDSAVSTYLCVKALGKENVLGISMSCFSSPDSRTDAIQLSENLKIKLLNVPIITIYNETLSTLNFKKTDKNYQLIQANLKARLRMVILYSYANSLNRLVIGTSNLSETKIGYFTKFGDGAADLEPIGSYYKTEVYSMAKLMPEIPESILIKEPSADLWDGQKDIDEIGMSYQELDQILKAIEEGNNRELDKIEINNLIKIQNMIKSSIHKNNIPPRYERT